MGEEADEGGGSRQERYEKPIDRHHTRHGEVRVPKSESRHQLFEDPARAEAADAVLELCRNEPWLQASA